jgi:hypothetical protein
MSTIPGEVTTMATPVDELLTARCTCWYSAVPVGFDGSNCNVTKEKPHRLRFTAVTGYEPIML